MKQRFAEIASTESDCSSASKGGDLGWFGRGMMQKSFEVSASGPCRGGQVPRLRQRLRRLGLNGGLHVIAPRQGIESSLTLFIFMSS
jgi:hypothetical protein